MKKLLTIVVFVATTMVGLATVAPAGTATAGTTPTGSGPYSISGDVLFPPGYGDDGDWPSGWVTLRTLSGQQVDDSPSSFHGGFSLHNVGTGRYLLSMTFDDTALAAPWWYGDTAHPDAAAVIEVTGHDVTDLHVQARLSGSIAGSITDQAGGAIEDGHAQAYLLDQTTGSLDLLGETATDESGGYQLPGMPAGSYVMQFSQWSDHRVPDFADTFSGDVADLSEAVLVQVAEGEAVVGIDAHLGPWVTRTARLTGVDRFEVSAQASAAGFASGAPVAYVADGLNWPDALSAGPAAAFRGGPVLLVTRDSVPAVIRAELQRLQPAEIVVVGGANSVSDGVLSQLGDLAPEVRRLGGADRYEVSRRVVLDAFGPWVDSRTIFVASGRTFPDALSAGAVAAANEAPVFLIDGKAPQLDPVTRQFLFTTIYTSMNAVGGPNTIDDYLVEELAYFTKWETSGRYGGADRFAVNRALNAYDGYLAAPALQHKAYLVSGQTFPDALSATTLAAAGDARVFLASTNCVPRETLAIMRGLHISEVVLVGGPATLSEAVRTLTPC